MGIAETLKQTSINSTPLALALANSDRPQATPLEVFKIAKKKWCEGERISIGELAAEVGISRGTLYRWVGSKDLLMDEVFWAITKPAFEQAVKETPGCGIDHIVGVHRRFMKSILSFTSTQRFIKEEPSYALRMLTNPSSGVSKRVIMATAKHLQAQEEMGHLRFHSNTEKLAEIFVLANQGILYSDVISGRSPAIDKACELIRLLLTASVTIENRVTSME